MTGTTIYTSGVHTFTLPSKVTKLEYLVVAGGGGGGNISAGLSVGSGAGGAGGMLEGFILNPNSGNYVVTVGAGTTANGNDSSIVKGALNILAHGGGGGGGSGSQLGLVGGSGGGNATNVVHAGGGSYAGEGNNGGSSSSPYGGGGGGKLSAGQALFGGSGKTSSISGSPIVYAKGGNGGVNNAHGNGNAGAVNTGNGGNGASNSGGPAVNGGIGGSGIVVLRYTSLPAITTNSITLNNGYTATCGGNVTSSGDSFVSAYGICWAKTQNPTLVNQHTIDGSGVGNFISQLTGLSENIIYYVRAYATNSGGTEYGNQQTFTSIIVPPNLTGGTDMQNFPNIGWSGVTQVTTWTGATSQRWYGKISTAPSYTLLATLGKATGNTYQKLHLLPNLNYSFYSTFYKTGTESLSSNVITINNTVATPVATYSSILIV